MNPVIEEEKGCPYDTDHKPQETESKPIIAEENDRSHDEDRKPQETGGLATGAIATVATVFWMLYLVAYFEVNDIKMDSYIGYLTLRIITPHMICVFVASAISFVGLFCKKRWILFACGILMVVSGALFTPYIPAVIVPAIFFFISFGRMHP